MLYKNTMYGRVARFFGHGNTMVIPRQMDIQTIQYHCMYQCCTLVFGNTMFLLDMYHAMTV